MTTRGLWILMAVLVFFWGSTVLGIAMRLAERHVGGWWAVLVVGILPVVLLVVVASRSGPRRETVDGPDAAPRGGRVGERARDAEDLTHREQEVLELLAAGRTNRQIAEALYVTPATVKSHVNAICRKLAAENRTHAVAIARELGLLP